ncbi:hypothetical protein BaRGS_00007579 [Batillaria attramentaria]|uniref:Uncharacterized protein n=1 Tax=Batillaria attramentaria TaxID=370345 RepID=A0ABD0LN90_9CAEN
MAPTTCDSFDKCDEAKATEGAAAANSTSHPCQQTYTVDDEPGPFYGMFSSRDFEPEAEWVRSTVSSPRTVIPEASETFLRAMKQLDTKFTGTQECSGESHESRSSCCASGARPKDSKHSSSSGSERPRRSSKLVKKSASFSAQTSSSSSSSSSSGKTTSKTKADGSSRRMSMPCTRSEKHVQWADEAGVADLVSVRLIRPRIAVGDKDEKHPSPVRSILRRLTGAN